jgi:biopolymer transport protein ExbD
MRRHRKTQDEAELDITSFMNLMIILVPVLLMSMVFNQITVLELALPLEDQKKLDELDPEDKTPEIVVRKTGFVVNLGIVPIGSAIPKKDGKYDLEQLSKALIALKKTAAKGRTDIVILAEPDIDYQVLVAVIDAARSYEAVLVTSVVNAVLFPDVSLGDAPEEKKIGGGK